MCVVARLTPRSGLHDAGAAGWVTGTAAHGAVLYTASGAAFRGMNVIVPVDGLSAESLFPELYTVWNLANAPRVSAKTVITKMGLIMY